VSGESLPSRTVILNHLRTIQTWLHECEIKLESTYNLTRTRASAFLGFMISDVDRNYREEELHSIPIAYKRLLEHQQPY
jgi:hypothetical protein